jgi:hypothetical protein
MSDRARFASRWAALVLLCLCSLLVFGQDNSQNSQTNQSRTVRTPLQVIVTGCLKKGSEPGRYYITDAHGRTWELSSKKVDLAAQVFDVVSISGHPASSKTQEEQSEQSQKPAAGVNQSLALDVVELTMVNNSCTR